MDEWLEEEDSGLFGHYFRWHDEEVWPVRKWTAYAFTDADTALMFKLRFVSE